MTTTTVPSPALSEALSYGAAFAEFYDQNLTNFVRSVAAPICGVLAGRSGIGNGQWVVDLGCGTGVLASALLRQGWRVACIDRSPAMLDIAGARLREAIQIGDAVLVEGDIASFALPGEVGEVVAVTATDGVLGHLLEVDRFRQVFDWVGARLVPGGVFIFDLYTLRSLFEFNNVYVFDTADELIVGRGLFDSAGGVATMVLSGCVPADPTVASNWARFNEVIRARHWEEDVVGEVLSSRGLGLAPATPESIHLCEAVSELERRQYIVEKP